MAKFIGRRVAVGVALEGSRGEGGAPTHVVAKTNYTLDDKANKAVSGEGVGSISANGSGAFVTGKFAEGSIDFELGAKSLPVFLSAVFGGEITTVSAGTGEKHTVAFSESNQHKTLAVSLDDPNGDVMFRGASVDSFEVTIAPDSIVSGTLAVKSKASVSTSYTAVPSAEYKWVGRDLTFKVADDTSGLSAATNISTKELSFTVNKNSDYDWMNGTLEPEDIYNKQFTLEGKITLNYEDRTWRDYMLSGDYKAVSIKLEQSRDDAGDQNPTFYLELPKVHFSDWESSRENDDIVGQTLTFTALYDVSTGKVVSDVYVINDETSY